MLDLILIYLLVRGAAEAWKETKAAWGGSRKAYTASAGRRYPGMSPRRRAAAAARHDLGYGLSQLLHGFPTARHGFAQGWNEGRQAHVQARTARERARTEHAETRAGALAQWRELQQRRREAQEEIRRQRQGEVPEGSFPEVDEHEEPAPAAYCGYCGTRSGEQCPPHCATWTRDNPYPGREDGPAYSYGYEGSTAGWPAATVEQAHRQAQSWSGDGDPWVVTEYPPGGGPGRTIATYRNGEVVPPVTVGTSGCGIASETPIRCMQHPGRACQWVQYQDGTGEHVTGPEQEVPGEGSSTTTEGTTTMSDVTYDGVIRSMNSAVEAAEDRGESARTAHREAAEVADQMQALEVDPATLGAMADHLDALDAAAKAEQHVLDTARNVHETLQRGHAQLAEAHKDAVVAAADRAFYQD